MTDNAWSDDPGSVTGGIQNVDPREEDETEPTKTDIPPDGPAPDEPVEEE
jgi:hypothetical protein